MDEVNVGGMTPDVKNGETYRKILDELKLSRD